MSLPPLTLDIRFRCRFMALPLLLILSFPVFLHSTDAPARSRGSSIAHFTRRTWLREQGLPQNSVNAIIQSRAGYLWLGTQEGAARFDGKRFTLFNRRTLPALRSNYVWSLYEDRTDAVWIGTSGGGVTQVRGDSAWAFTDKNGLPGRTVWCITEDTAGTIYVGTDEGAAIRRSGAKPDDSTAFVPIFATLGHSVRTIIPSPNGSGWILGTSHGVWIERDGRLRKLPLLSSATVHAMRFVHLEGRRQLLIATTTGLHTLEGEQILPVPTPPALQRAVIFDMQNDDRGSLWVATGGAGIWRFAQGTWSSFTSTNGLPDDQVRSVWVDHERTVWAGTYGGGLNALREPRFTTFTHQHGLTNEFVLSVCEAPDGSMWFGTYGGGLNRWNGSSVQNFPPARNGVPAVVISLATDHAGRLFIGSPEGQLRVRNLDGTIAPVGSAPTMTSTISLHTDSRGRIWAGSSEGLAVIDGQRTTLYTPSNSPIRGAVIAVADEGDSGQWIGTQGFGLYHVQNGRFEHYTVEHGLPTDVITSLYIDAEKALWIGTDGGGLVQLRGGRFVVCSSAHGLFDDVIYTIFEDGAGYLWMSSNNGIFRIRKHEAEQFANGERRTISSQSFDVSDGMASSECNGRRQPSGWKDRRGRLWFATLKGVVMVDPATLRLNPTPPNVKIERIIADDQRYVPSDGISLAAGTNRLTIEYTALSFAAPERNAFRFRLDGYDADWIEAANERVASYTNLAPGEYRFRVIGRNNDGIWNEAGASLSFTLMPFFYETPYFIGGVILVFFLLAFAIGRIRVARLQRREIQLVELVADRTQNLTDEKLHVEAALRDAEDARRNAEHQMKIAEEASLLKSRLLHLAAHDLKSPLISIKGFTQIMRVEAAADTAIAEMAEMVHSLTVNMLSLINQLLNSEAIESGRMTLIRRPIDLGRLAQEVVTANSIFAANKQQTIRFEDRDPGRCIVEADLARMRDALDNLVTNAVKYSPPGVPIIVSVFREGRTARFAVTDQGPGLTAEDKAKIFGSFQRLSAQPTAGESTTGIGLAITKEIVAMHDGTILVESEEGRGSTFIIELVAMID